MAVGGESSCFRSMVSPLLARLQHPGDGLYSFLTSSRPVPKDDKSYTIDNTWQIKIATEHAQVNHIELSHRSADHLKVYTPESRRVCDASQTLICSALTPERSHRNATFAHT